MKKKLLSEKTITLEEDMSKEIELYLKSLNEDAYNKFVEKYPFPKDEIINGMMTRGIAITHTDSNGSTRVIKSDTDE